MRTAMCVAFLGAILVTALTPMATFGMSNHATLGSEGQRVDGAAMTARPHLRSDRLFAHRRSPQQFGFPFGIVDTAIPETVDLSPPIFPAPPPPPLISNW